MTASDQAQSLVMVKWGGGLITDKSSPESLDQPTLDRLAREINSALDAHAVPLILGHGSGSFGHWSARGSFLSGTEPLHGRLNREQLAAAARTADAAARLHRMVVASLLEAGAAPCSWLPSSAAFDLEHGEASVRSLVEALDRGFLPVTMGDVVISARTGAAIWSTEQVLEVLIRHLSSLDRRVERILWMGNTDGVLDATGSTICEIDADTADEAGAAVGGSDGVDVTGGMRLRFETCRALASVGIESWVLDGRSEGVLERGIGGERMGGTRFVAARLT